MIEPEFLEQLDRFHLSLKKNSVQMQQGEQSSDYSGQGMIFKDHKQYVPGDDIRRIDWKAYARTKDYFVKRFEEERSITLHILLDRSSSMDYGDENKYDYAARLGLGLAYMALNTNDRFRFSVFSETVTDVSSGRRNGNIPDIIDTLNGLRKTPESRVQRCLTEYSGRIENKSAVIILSDFLTDLDEIEAGVESLKDTDTVLVNVLDETELNPEFEGDAILKDPESDSRLRTYLSRRTKDSYTDKLDSHLKAIEESAARSGAEYVQVSTGDEFFDSFLRIWKLLNS